jgi:hypothetical protein
MAKNNKSGAKTDCTVLIAVEHDGPAKNRAAQEDNQPGISQTHALNQQRPRKAGVSGNNSWQRAASYLQ